MAKFCLTLICAPEIEEKLLDMLLVEVDDAAFTSAPTFSHGATPHQLSNAEQVMGRSRAMQIEIIVGEDELNRLTELMRQSFKGTGLRYWSTVLHAEGDVL